MTRRDIDIFGLPYVPGSVRARLRRATHPEARNGIVLLAESDMETLAAAPLGMVVVDGAPLSHRMIRLMGLGVPTVIVSSGQALALEPGREILLDGSTGRISSHGDASRGVISAPPTGPTCTADGTEIRLLASVRNHATARRARENGAEAIGLVRSEFVAPQDDRQPDLDFYVQALGEICRAAAPLDVTVRLLDVGADKMPGWLPPTGLSDPSLGLQGVRLFGSEPVRSVCLAQLAAIRKLSGQSSLRVLLPYLARHEELHFWADRLRRHLPDSVPIGAMAETPAAALDLGRWFDRADFVALGCNDLMQCLFAADRSSPDLRNYLDPYAPPLYRFLRQIAVGAQGHLRQVQLCGVLAQLPGVLPVLLGLGYRVFSVEAALIPHLRQTVLASHISEAEILAERACGASESRQVREILGIVTGLGPPFLLPQLPWED